MNSQPLTLSILRIPGKVFFPHQPLNITFDNYEAIQRMEDAKLWGLITVLENSEEKYKNDYKLFQGRIGLLTKKSHLSQMSLTPIFCKNSFIPARRVYMMKGVARIRIKEVVEIGQHFFTARVEVLDDETIPKQVHEKLVKEKMLESMIERAEQVIETIYTSESARSDKISQFKSETSFSKVGYLLLHMVSRYVGVKQKLAILETNDLQQRLKLILKEVQKFLDFSEKKAESIKSFEGKGLSKEIDENVILARKIRRAKMPPEAEKLALRELKKLQKMSQGMKSTEASWIENFLEVLTEMPWNHLDPETKDIAKAEEILDRDHFGLDKVKRRILEHLAVRQLKKEDRFPTILCFVGPPGVGKTSLGQSIARALGRKFQRLSLGGVVDEAFIRGHRRTYVGAMPGQFISALRRLKTKNPVILLDEIDKIGRHSIRGDPSSALLEVLDPAQNAHFKDHYLEAKFDLSKVMFIATANKLETVQPALLDRMEVIELSGYSLQEKLQIAKRYMVSRNLTENGFTIKDIGFNDGVLEQLISNYTLESGCRNLNRAIGSVVRGLAYQKVQSAKKGGRVDVDFSHLVRFLGPPKYNLDVEKRISRSGVAFGLAFTEAGGKLLLIEATKYPGNGSLKLTGSLGDMIKESVETALSWIRSNVKTVEQIVGPLRLIESRIPKQQKVEVHDEPPASLSPRDQEVASFFEKSNIHLHFPSAAIPKDGPSAGITILTAMVSLLTGRQVRGDLAMTGEISLQGLVLPIGGVKEKCLAAHRAGMNKVLLPAENAYDTEEIAKDVKNKLDIILVDRAEQVLEEAFSKDSRLAPKL